ncbi:MAG: UDP-N-acetylmuramate--L-alanine ligase, partial [Proteobacteria bacterium]|nr:UDP-N-acetylmuramate--L-alanine ligase [Pseudomonadota bacterium]
RFPKNKIRVVFQPHRFSRTEDLFDRFSTCFNHCDAVAVTDIYAAGESSTGAISAELLAESIARTGHPKAVHVQKPLTAIENWMIDSQPGDIIMTLGAGDLPSVYRNLFT